MLSKGLQTAPVVPPLRLGRRLPNLLNGLERSLAPSRCLFVRSVSSAGWGQRLAWVRDATVPVGPWRGRAVFLGLDAALR